MTKAAPQRFSPRQFRQQARLALNDANLRTALQRAGAGFVTKRALARAELPEFERLCDAAAAVRDHALDNLDRLLVRFEQEVLAAGGQVHWAETPAEASAIVTGICQDAGAKKVAKGKSMVGEEVGLNPALEAAGFDLVETDLGEYIIQLAKEPPSHIIAPAVHKTREQVAELFERHHDDLHQRLQGIPELVDEARRVMRKQFLTADVGITGANLLIAETGSTVLVTNEGNGDLCATLPDTHIVITGIEKVVANAADAATILRVLARSATGQPITAYTSFFTGPRRAEDLDGPRNFHVVLVDNGRSQLRAGRYRDMLRCIRCGACLNHCPVYTAIGGHAYGAVYPGPMGAVLTPLQWGLREAADLPNACTLNGRCGDVCPVRIPLPSLLRRLREDIRAAAGGRLQQWLIGAWAKLALRPVRYHRLAARLAGWLRRLAGARGRVSRLLPVPGWRKGRDLPAPQGQSFFAQYRARQAELAKAKPGGEP
jgi:L-lactate dehydrogenase complex protein LldF